jgi:hypothetical protein
MPSALPKPASTRRRSPTCIRAPWPRACSKRRWNSSSWPSPRACGPTRPPPCPRSVGDFKTFTFRIKPGIYFADDPAFKGVKRELTAEDYVYSLKRHYDPRWKSGNLYILENAKILGLSELRREALAEKKPFDYDTPVEGLRALDRYTFQVRLGEAHAALPVQLHRRLLHRRAGARGGGVLRRQDRRAPGGHRALRAEGLEAQLAHRAGAQPQLPRGALRRAPAGRRRAPAGDGRAFKGRACRCSTRCTSPSSKNRSRAG